MGLSERRLPCPRRLDSVLDCCKQATNLGEDATVTSAILPMINNYRNGCANNRAKKSDSDFLEQVGHALPPNLGYDHALKCS